MNKKQENVQQAKVCCIFYAKLACTKA